MRGPGRPTTIYLTYGGKTMSLKEWAKRRRMTSHVLWTRLNRGWSLHRALMTEKRRYDGA